MRLPLLLARRGRGGCTHATPPTPLFRGVMAASTAAAAAASGDGPIAARIRASLATALAPLLHLELVNESHMHSRGEPESHFKLLVVSPVFDGMPVVGRHRVVMAAVQGGDASLPVHALSIQAKTPAQWQGGAGAKLHATPACRGGED